MFLGTERLDIVARKGASFTVPIRVQTDEVVWKAITSIEKSAPAIIGVVGHECPTGWPVTFHSVGGMTELNAPEDDPGSKTYRVAPIDENTLSIPRLNTSRFKTYTSGGYISYKRPLSLVGYIGARMEIRESVDGPLLFRLDVDSGSIEIDAETNTIWLKLTPLQTESFTFDKGVFDIELFDALGEVVNICGPKSTFTVIKEITTGV